MKRTRKSLSYKINMWFYRLTFQDIKKFINNITLTILEILMILLGFLIIFLLPALFH